MRITSLLLFGAACAHHKASTPYWRFNALVRPATTAVVSIQAAPLSDALPQAQG